MRTSQQILGDFRDPHPRIRTTPDTSRHGRTRRRSWRCAGVGDRSGQVAKDFDLAETAVWDWVKQADIDAGTRSDARVARATQGSGSSARRSGVRCGGRICRWS
jgi:hypothetical protein